MEGVATLQLEEDRPEPPIATQRRWDLCAYDGAVNAGSASNVKDSETRGWHRLSLRDVGKGDWVSMQDAVEKKNVPRKNRRSLVGKLRFSREPPTSDKRGAARRQRLWR